MSRWRLYHRLTWLDIVRLWPSVQHHVIIVAGICLPILVLLGLKNGHVDELRDDLVTSPTGTQVIVRVSQRGRFFTRELIDDLSGSISGIRLIIPAVERLVNVSHVDANGETKTADSITLLATRQGDPILDKLGADIIGRSKNPGTTIVLSQNVAVKIAAKVGDKVRLTVSRSRQSVRESANVEMVVGGVLNTGEDDESATAYATVDSLLAMERYVMGYQVAEFGWPAIAAPAPDSYSGYLLFSKKGEMLDDNDLRTLDDRGLKIEELKDPDVRGLFGLLKPEAADAVNVAFITLKSTPSGSAWGNCDIAPRDISRMTKPDDIAVPWNTAKEILIGGSPYRAVGLTLPKITWLKQYLAAPDLGFTIEDSTMEVAFLGGTLPPDTSLKVDDRLSLALKARQIDLGVKPPPKDEGVPEKDADPKPADGEVPESKAAPAAGDADPKPPLTKPSDIDSNADSSESKGENASTAPASEAPPVVAPAAANASATTKQEAEIEKQPAAPAQTDVQFVVVPMELLAYLYAYEMREVEFDATNQLFVEPPKDPTFAKARLYCSTIDDVPSVVAEFQKRGYSATSEAPRIEEIHHQTDSLGLLVLIVGVAVFVFGIVTVVSVLSDSTNRKRCTLGILRVMGVSRRGVFYTVFLRSTIIALLAIGLTIALGYGLAYFMSWQPVGWFAWKPVINIVIRKTDLLIVGIGALACCGLGSLVPAFWASRLDPFEAIAEGRFR